MDYPIKKIELANPLSPEERAALIAACGPPIDVAPRADIVLEGERTEHSTVLLDGLIYRYKVLPNGDRQILAVHTPGDWPDLHSYLLKTMDHSMGALTRCTIAHLPHSAIRQLIDTHPRLGELLWRETMLDSAILREWVVNLGVRDAYARTAHLVCEIQAKLAAVGIADVAYFELPMTQVDLGDAIGVSTVHMNRTVQRMKGEGLIACLNRSITILDLPRLQHAGGFDYAYLHLPPRARPATFLEPLLLRETG